MVHLHLPSSLPPECLAFPNPYIVPTSPPLKLSARYTGESAIVSLPLTMLPQSPFKTLLLAGQSTYIIAPGL